MSAATGQFGLVLKQAVLVVAAANLAYFVIETAVALHIGSVSLLADGIDFFEDALVNLLVFFALALSLRVQHTVAILLAALMVFPSLATVWMAWQKFNNPAAPDVQLLALTGVGALCVNLACAWLLARFRHAGGSMVRAAFLSARNDVLANVLILVAAAATFQWASGWPDLIAGAIIFAVNLEAAYDVYKAARRERAATASEATP